MISPAGIRGGATAADIGSVNHIVVDQRGAMNQLDDGTQTNRRRAGVAAKAGGEQEQGGAQALPSPLKKILADFRNRLDGVAGLRGNFFFDARQILANELEDFLCSNDGDFRSPWKRASSERTTPELRGGTIS